MLVRYSALLLGLIPAFASAANPGAASTFRADSNLVLVRVTVLERNGRPVRNLSAENFELTEDNRPQKVSYFLKEEMPVSIAIVADLSHSMSRKMDALRRAVERFVGAANAEDEFCLVTLRDQAQLVHDFGVSPGQIVSEVQNAQADGHTALLDGLYLAAHQMRKARYARRAIFVISDGGDNHSRFTAHDLSELAVESDTAIYAVEPPGSSNSWAPEEGGLLQDLADLTGGHDYRVEDPSQLASAARQIGIELRSQYVLGYIPEGVTADGKYHRLRVKLVPPPGLPRLSAYWRRGYFAPGN